MVCEPHSGIISQVRLPVLDLSARDSQETRKISTELIQGSYNSLIKDMEVIRTHSSDVSKMISLKTGAEQWTALHLENKEFKRHPVLNEDFSKSNYLKDISQGL